jgi:hypothetical protein
VSLPRARVLAGIALILLVVAGLALVRWQDERCPDETVFYQDGCVFPDSLSVVLKDGQDRAHLEAAIAAYDGKIRIDVAERIFSVTFPVEDVEELDRVRAALEAAGFQVGFSIPGELFANRWTRTT